MSTLNKKVLITGTFDLIHPGHLNLISQAKKLGDFLVAVVAKDENVFKVKGREPYFNEQQRLKNLQKLNLVDKVVLGDNKDPYKIIKEEKPDIVALGYDQSVFVDQLEYKLKELKLKTKIVRLKPFKEDFCKGKNIRKAFEDNQSRLRSQASAGQAGFLLMDKDQDWTSHDVVAKLRSILKIKQIGHTGTLDPFATGLLICAIGNATKMVGLFDLLPKTYVAKIKLGVVSDTYDRTGKLEVKKKDFKITENDLFKALKKFIGKQKQLPPMYSAKKVDGKKLYQLARKGIEIKRKPSEIEIYDIKLLGFAGDMVDIEVKCSSGTYIRSLAYDLGQKLKIGAVLWELNRTKIGDFSLEKAVKLSKVSLGNMINPSQALEVINKDYLTTLDFLRK